MKPQAPASPARFFAQDGRWKMRVDLRSHPRSSMNSKAYKNASIAKLNGRLPDVELQTNGACLLVISSTSGSLPLSLAIEAFL